MGHRKNVYFSDTVLNYLSTKDNASKYVDDLVIRDMNGKSEYIKRREELLDERKELHVKIADIDLELKSIDVELNRIAELESIRPDGYEDVVDTLLSMVGAISPDELVYQADVLGVDVGLLKRWLFEDGVYDRLIMER